MTTIHVTQEHIDRGAAGDCYACPVALAILDKVQPGLEIDVQPDQYSFYDDGYGEWKYFPIEVNKWIGRFDNDEKAEPFSFDLDIPSDLLRP